MTRNIFFVLGVVMALQNTVSSQSAGIEGYEGNSWGSTIQEVKNKFPTIRLLPDFSDSDFKNQSNTEVYSEEQNGKSVIENRIFVFIDGKLVKVYCTYKNGTFTDIRSFSSLVAKFGEINKTTSENITVQGKVLKSDRLVWYNFNGTRINLLRITSNDGVELLLAISYISREIALNRLGLKEEYSEIEF